LNGGIELRLFSSPEDEDRRNPVVLPQLVYQAKAVCTQCLRCEVDFQPNRLRFGALLLWSAAAATAILFQLMG
jgi:hypothetical protein